MPRAHGLWSLPVGTVTESLGLRPCPTIPSFLNSQTTNLSKLTRTTSCPSAMDKVPRAFPTVALTGPVTWSHLPNGLISRCLYNSCSLEMEADPFGQGRRLDWGSAVQAENSECKGPEVDTCYECSRSSQETCGWSRQREGRVVKGEARDPVGWEGLCKAQDAPVQVSPSTLSVPAVCHLRVM